jgi:hypothetical protein
VTDPTVNNQIKDAVQTSTNWALGFATLDGGTPSSATRVSAGGVIAYDKATQAAALSVQDAADYQRNVMSISTAVQGKAMAMMLASEGTDDAALVAYVMALVSAFAAPIAAGLAAESVTKAVESFPRN